MHWLIRTCLPASVLAGLLLAQGAAVAADLCAPRDFEGGRFTVCTIARDDGELRLFATDGEGKPYGSFSNLEKALTGRGLALRFGMNAGMYDQAQLPVGYYVEDGRQSKKLLRNNGEGNFYLKDRKSTRLNSSHGQQSRMPSSA